MQPVFPAGANPQSSGAFAASLGCGKGSFGSWQRLCKWRGPRAPNPCFWDFGIVFNAGISAGEFTSPPLPGFSWKLILCSGTWETSIQNYFYRVWAALEVPSQREWPSPLAVELFDGGTSLGWGMELERAQSPPVPLARPEEAEPRPGACQEPWGQRAPNYFPIIE